MTDNKKLNFGKEYEELQEIAKKLSENSDLVEEDGISIIITIADDEKVLTAGCVGDIVALQYSLMLIMNGIFGGEDDEETNGNLN